MTDDERPGSRPHMTVRQRRLLDGVIAGKTGAQAARDAGYPTQSARQAASRFLARADVRQHVRALLEREGLDDSTIARKHRELLDVRSYGITREGDVVDLGPDGTTQVKALELAYRLADYLPNPRLDVDTSVSAAVIVIRAEDALAGLDPFSAPMDVTPSNDGSPQDA